MKKVRQVIYFILLFVSVFILSFNINIDMQPSYSLTDETNSIVTTDNSIEITDNSNNIDENTSTEETPVEETSKKIEDNSSSSTKKDVKSETIKYISIIGVTALIVAMVFVQLSKEDLD